MPILKTLRRSMGLPPTTQGHNNLRLINTTNSYQNYRLGTNLHTLNSKQNSFNRFLLPSMSNYTNCKQSSRKHLLSRPPNAVHYHQYNAPQVSFSKTQTNNVMYVHKRNLPRGNQVRHVRFSEPPPILFNLRKDRTRPPDTAYACHRKKSIPKPRHHKGATNSQISTLNTQRKSSFSHRNPIVSNMPLINVNSSILLVNHSPFALTEPQFGILHHCSQSVSYF